MSDVIRITEITSSSSTASGQRSVMTTEVQETASESCTSVGYDGALQAEKLSMYHGYGMFIGLAVVSFIIARGAIAVRYLLYKDKNVMDTTFDAGGKVSVGMVSTYIVSQWIWADGLLTSASATTKYGIGGAFWYAAGTTTQLFVFTLLIYQLKIRAPGAKTFLQVIQARFGKTTHLTFCSFAILTNVIITILLMLGGSAALIIMIDEFSVVLATLLFVATIAIYTLMGGLGAALYVSYFNTGSIMVMMMVFFVKIFFDGSSPDTDNPLGSIEIVFKLVNNSRGQDNGDGFSYLTMLSYPALIFGIINLVGNYGAVFVGQSFWQCGASAKPTQGVIGFLAGGLTWFSIPFVFGTAMGLAYVALSEMRGSPLLSDDQISQGLAAPVVSRIILGQNGASMVTIMILMTVTSAGSAQVMAVTSIIIYDIYQTYLKPYRLVFDASTCILCGRERGRLATARDKCVCVSMTYCHACTSDDDILKSCKRAMKPGYCCTTHGSFRAYNDYLSRLKNWCHVVVIISIVPLTLVVDAIGVGPGWLYLFMGVLIGSAVIPISLCLFWTKLTGPAMTAGAIGGTILAIISWLIMSSYQPGGLANFFDSTGSDFSMMAGNVVSILSSGIISICVTVVHALKHQSAVTGLVSDSLYAHNDVWENTRDIDNPLRPWTEIYTREMKLNRFASLTQRPRLDEMANRFRFAKIVAIFGSTALTFGVLFAWPSITLSAGNMDISTFSQWIHLAAVYGFTATAFILIMPIVTECYELRCHMIALMTVEPVPAPRGSVHVHRDQNNEVATSSFERSLVDDCAATVDVSRNSLRTNYQEELDSKQVLDIIDISEHIVEANNRSISSGAVTAYFDGELKDLNDAGNDTNYSPASPDRNRQLEETQT